MKCEICGAEMESGESVCRYCGNVIEPKSMPENKKTEFRVSHEENTQPKTQVNPSRAAEMQPEQSFAFKREHVVREHPSGRFCTKCGRPLDGRTGKCVVCDVAELSHDLRANAGASGGNAEMAKKKKKTNTALKIVIAVLILIIIFMATAMVFFKLLEPETEDEQATVHPTAEVTMAVQTEAPEKTAMPVQNNRAASPTQRVQSTPKPTERNGDAGKTSTSYIYPSDKQRLTVSELEDILSKDGAKTIRYMYFEMYARHGLTFGAGTDLEEHFEYVTGYMPTMPVGSSDEIEDEFNSIEEYNNDLLEEFMEDHNIRDDEY